MHTIMKCREIVLEEGKVLAERNSDFTIFRRNLSMRKCIVIMTKNTRHIFVKNHF